MVTRVFFLCRNSAKETGWELFLCRQTAAEMGREQGYRQEVVWEKGGHKEASVKVSREGDNRAGKPAGSRRGKNSFSLGF